MRKVLSIFALVLCAAPAFCQTSVSLACRASFDAAIPSILASRKKEMRANFWADQELGPNVINYWARPTSICIYSGSGISAFTNDDTLGRPLVGGIGFPPWMGPFEAKIYLVFNPGSPSWRNIVSQMKAAHFPYSETFQVIEEEVTIEPGDQQPKFTVYAYIDRYGEPMIPTESFHPFIPETRNINETAMRNIAALFVRAMKDPRFMTVKIDDRVDLDLETCLSEWSQFENFNIRACVAKAEPKSDTESIATSEINPHAVNLKPKSVIIPAGAIIFIGIRQKISTADCRVGEHISAKLVSDVVIPGTNKVIIGSGIPASVTVTECQSAPGVLGLRLDSITTGNTIHPTESDELYLRGAQPKYYSAKNRFKGISAGTGNEAVLLPSMTLKFQTGKDITVQYQ